MARHAQLKFVMTECSKTQIRLTRPMSSNVVPIITLRQVLGVGNTAVWTASQMLNKLLWEEWMFDTDQIGDLFSVLKALVKNKCIALEFISIVRKWQETKEDAQSLVLLARTVGGLVHLIDWNIFSRCGP